MMMSCKHSNSPDYNFRNSGSVPPGARFDPIGPFGNNPNAGPQGSFGSRGSGPGRSFRGEPDNDELPPPVRKLSNVRKRPHDDYEMETDI